MFCKVVLPPHGFIIKPVILGGGSLPIFSVLDSQSGEITWKYQTTCFKMSFQLSSFQDREVITVVEL